MVGIHVDEQPSGGLSVSVGGEFLVFEGQRREVAIGTSSDNGIAVGVVQFADTQSPLQPTSGELQGLYTARDEIVGGFLDGLDELAGTLAFEFNKVYSQGQGLVGFQQLTSVETVTDADAALDAAGLAFTPVSGTFDVLIHSKDDNLHDDAHDPRRPRMAWMRTRRSTAWPRSSTRSTAVGQRSRRPARCSCRPIRRTSSLHSPATRAACWRRWG